MILPICRTVLFISLILLLVLGQVLHGVVICPNCGNLSVPYPFSTSSSCGHPLYPITCTPHKTLQVDALSGNYTIDKSVDASTRTFTIATSNFLGDSCITQDSVLSGNFSLHTTRPFFITPNNTILMFNASGFLFLSPVLQCRAASPCHQALTVFAQKSCRNLQCCSVSTALTANIFRYGFPVKNQESTGYTSVVNLINNTPPTAWDYGLQLGWEEPQEPPCTAQSQCGANSTCSSRPNGVGAFCLCDGGYEWDSTTGTCPKAPYCVWRSRSVECHQAEYAVGLTLGIVGLVAMSALTVYMYMRGRAAQRAQEKLVKERSAILAANSGGKSARLFSSQEMKRATNNFACNRVLGSGGFGEVYKGILNDGTVVAIKSAKIGNIKGTDQVLNEVRILSQVNHRNLVRLLGCCVESQLPMMVYEYVPNGDLYDHLSGGKGSFLDWKIRLRVGFQSAEGLAYLHSAAYPPIYHRDVKSRNILLDESMNARVADFGMSRLTEPDSTHVSTCAQGTLGYLDPEYYRTCQLTDKSDVYSFGIVLLELVTSKRVIDFGRNQDEVNLAVMVQDRVEQGKLDDVPDPKLTKGASMVALESMRHTIHLALDCLKETRLDRPSMKEVAETLQQIISTQETIEQAGHWINT